MTEIPPELLGLVGDAPWLAAAWLAYSLGRRALADVCAAAERLGREGIPVRIRLDLHEDEGDGDAPRR